MTALSFSKDAATGKYVSEVTVGADFNLHIELLSAGVVSVAVSTVSGGEYKTVFKDFADKVFERDFKAAVYTKYIKIVCDRQPTGKSYLTEA